MSNDTSVSVSAPGVKAGTALAAGFTVSSWSDLAAVIAAIYSACLLGEWLWKKFIRPALEARGILTRARRRHDDE